MAKRRKLLREYVRNSLILESRSAMQKQYIEVGNSGCEVEIAKSDMEKSIGMMGRKVVPDGTGMLFIYENPMQMSFWMKDTPHPLDIAFIDAEGAITEIRNLQPFNEQPVRSSSKECVAALEVPAGWFSKNNIQPGDYIRL